MDNDDDDDDFPCLQRLVADENMNNANTPKCEPNFDDSGGCLSQNSLSLQIPKTPMKLNTKYAIGRIQRNLGNLDQKKSFLSNFNDDADGAAGDKVPFENEAMEILPSIDESTAYNIGEQQNSLEYKGLEFFSENLCETSMQLFQPAASIIFNPMNNRDEYLELLFNRLAFSRNDDEMNSLMNSFFYMQPPKEDVKWSPSLTQFLAILAAYGANLNLITFISDEIKNNVLTYLKGILVYFEIPKERILLNLTGIVFVIENYLNWPFFPGLEENIIWLSVLFTLNVDKLVKFAGPIENQMRNFVFHTVSLIPNEIRSAILSHLIPVLANLSDDSMILAELCSLIEYSNASHTLTVRSGLEFGRKIFILSEKYVFEQNDENPNLIEIDEFSNIMVQIERDLPELLTNAKRLCYSWLSILDVCYTIDYLNDQKFENIQRFTNLLSRWQNLIPTVGVSPAEASLKSLLFSLVNRMPDYSSSVKYGNSGNSKKAVFESRVRQADLHAGVSTSQIEDPIYGHNSFDSNSMDDLSLDFNSVL